MMSVRRLIRRTIARTTVSLRGADIWTRLHRGDVCCPILVYHGVSRRAAPDHVAMAEFEAQMRWLVARYQVVSLQTLQRAIRGGERLPPRAVVLTFDDGYANLVDGALPLLAELKLPGTIFVVPDLVGRAAAWSSNVAPELTRLLDWGDLAACARQGIEIGSHTLNHADLISVPEVEGRRQIGDSRTVISDRLGCDVTSFCYPWARLTEATVRWVREAGYSVACAGGWGALHRPETLLRLKRIGVEPGDTIEDFETKLRGGYLLFNVGAQRRTNRAVLLPAPAHA